MDNPVPQAKSAPRGAAGEWWSMVCFSDRVRSLDGQHWWVIAIVDSTEMSMPEDAAEPRPHPWHNQLLYSGSVPSTAPPNAEQSVAALLRAILIPGPGSGPKRRPERISVAWGMRHSHPALKELGEELGITVSVDSESLSPDAVAEQLTRLVAQSLNIAGYPETGKGLAAKKRRSEVV
jgi:hypothetical protein